MPRKKIISIVVLALILIGLIWVSRSREINIQKDTKEYSSLSYGISFSYNDIYHIEEKNTGNGERSRHTIILTEDTEENRLVREGKSPPREGPTAISIDIFQNLEKQSVESWIKNTSDSNYKLGDGTLVPLTLNQKDAFSYRWSGLYEGNSVVFTHKDNIVMMSVTFLTPQDQILTDFETLLATINFE